MYKNSTVISYGNKISCLKKGGEKTPKTTQC